MLVTLYTSHLLSLHAGNIVHVTSLLVLLPFFIQLAIAEYIGALMCLFIVCFKTGPCVVTTVPQRHSSDRNNLIDLKGVYCYHHIPSACFVSPQLLCDIFFNSPHVIVLGVKQLFIGSMK